MRLLGLAGVATAGTAVILFGTPAVLVAAPEPTASLSIRVAPLPEGTSAQIVVLGPDGYRAELSGSDVLTELEPGTYTASSITRGVSAAGWRPVDASASLTLGSNAQGVITMVFTPTPSNEPSRGDPSSYGFVAGDPGDPARWNPCQPISWQITTPAPTGDASLVAEALDELTAATGLVFVPTSSDPDIAVEISEMPGTRVEGEGSMDYLPGTAEASPRAISGKVVARIGTWSSTELRKALYLHELGHVIGLAHVENPDEVMYPVVDENDRLGFGAGDLTGLYRLGSASGCLEPPPAITSARGRISGGQLSVTWFQPAADPAVIDTRLRLTTTSDAGIAESTLAWSSPGQTGGSGTISRMAPLPEGLCSRQNQLSLVAHNAYGETVTPIRIPGCDQ